MRSARDAPRPSLQQDAPSSAFEEPCSSRGRKDMSRRRSASMRAASAARELLGCGLLRLNSLRRRLARQALFWIPGVRAAKVQLRASQTCSPTAPLTTPCPPLSPG
jgi:hypothetical protein